MKYKKTVAGIFIDRPNRFIAHVEIEGKIETVHVKNTGRCKELLVPGCRVILEDFRNNGENGVGPHSKSRKTQFDLIAVYKKLEASHPLYKKNDYLLINMDSQAPNKVAYEWLKSLQNNEAFDLIKPEFTYGKSRIDFYMEKECSATVDSPHDSPLSKQKFLMEIKGCTLEVDGVGYFPDAPTERGVKHLYELAEASKHGFNCILGFVIQIPNVKKVLPNIDTHPEFGKALDYAKANGVQVVYLLCDVKEDELKIVS